jgi:HD-GYP domain-containing protein (c-di-GMP phosphodiesterase class II)
VRSLHRVSFKGARRAPIEPCVTSSAAEQHVEAIELVEQSRRRATNNLRGRERLITAASAAGFLVTALLLATLASPGRALSLGTALVLIASYAIASRVEFEVGTGSAIPTQVVFVPMLFLLPARTLPLFVAGALMLGMLPEVLRRRAHPARLLVQLVNSWHAVGPALVMLAFGEPGPSWSSWPALVAAFAAQFSIDVVSSAIRSRLAFGIGVREHLASMAWVYLVDASLMPIGFALAIAAAHTSPIALLGMPLVGLLGLFARERQQRIDHALELGNAYRGTAFLLGDVIEADDEYTGSHSRDVVSLVLAVADELGLSPRERRRAELAALLHDVGKIRIPSEIINKPGSLTREERALIERHTIEGEKLLAKVGGLLRDVGNIVRSCHENWDGTGYPDGLAGEEIPRLARIIMCCDAFNAMTTDRSYRRALSPANAVAELRRNAGTQFDPVVVEALIERLPSLAPSQEQATSASTPVPSLPRAASGGHPSR